MKRTLLASCLFLLLLFAGGPVIAATGSEGAGPAEVLVTATRTRKSVFDIPASVQVIDRTAIRAANAVNVDELFRTVVGVDLQGSGFPGSEIKLNMRGFAPGYQSKRILVLVDGRRINDQYQGNVDFALLPADNVERIEILRGPASALHGSNAIGGVINIITRKGRETPVTRLKAVGGSHQTWHGRLAHGWKTGRFDYFVTASHVETDGYTSNSDGTDRDWSAENLEGNFGWELTPDSELRIYLGGYRGEGTDENRERETTKNYQSAQYTVRHGGESEPAFHVRLYRNAEDHDFDWKFPGKGVYEQATLGGEVQESRWIGERHLATAGVEWRRESVDIEEVAGDIDEDTAVAGAYLQDEFFLVDSLRVTAGLRGDYNADYGDELSPRLGLLWRVADDAEVFASVNRAHRAPALSDRFVRTVFNGMEFVGNPDLNPETLTSGEVGGRCRLGGRTHVELTFFHNSLKDAFDFMLDPDGVFRNRNATRIRSYGVEGELRCRLIETVSVFVNYSHTEGEYERFRANPAVEGNQLAYLAKGKAGFGLDYVGARGFSHALRCRYVGDRFGDAQNTPDNKMDDYVAADWRSRFPLGEHVQFTVNVDNIFDETYQEFPGLDQPGRIVMAGVEVEL